MISKILQSFFSITRTIFLTVDQNNFRKKISFPQYYSYYHYHKFFPQYNSYPHYHKLFSTIQSLEKVTNSHFARGVHIFNISFTISGISLSFQEHPLLFVEPLHRQRPCYPKISLRPNRQTTMSPFWVNKGQETPNQDPNNNNKADPSRVRVRVDPYNNSPNLKFRPFLDPNRGVNNSLL